MTVFTKEEREEIINAINLLARVCHGRARAGGWWGERDEAIKNLATAEALRASGGEYFDPALKRAKRLVMLEKISMHDLVHSELSEALEGIRKNSADDHLPQYSSEAVEFGDALIREFDYIAGWNLPVAEAFVDKIEYNAQRADHKPENRAKQGGKAI